MTAAVALLAAVLAAAALGWWCRRRLLIVTVAGSSMEPTLHDGDRVLVRRRRVTHCVRGDLIVFVNRRRPADAPADRHHPALLVKRVTAVAGDPVPAEVAATVGAASGAAVPPGCVVVRGDNPVSQDSRHFGYVTASDVVGVVTHPRNLTAADR